MPTDFRDGKTFPRRGRDELGGFCWLRRVADKGRAAAAGTIFDYIYPCPMDKGVMDRWGITPSQFDEALRACATDDELLAWLKARVDDSHRQAANDWLAQEKKSNLDRQDAEEGVAVA